MPVDGNAIDFVERGHGGKRARIEAGLVRLQIDFAQPLLRHIDRIVIEARLRSAVRGKMLDAGEHALGRLEVPTLKALHASSREQPAEQHVLAAAFNTAAPALIARDVDHWREGPVDTGARGFERRSFGGASRKIRLEARNLGEGNGEDGPMSVDDVAGEDQRDLHPRFPDRGILKNACHRRAVAVEHAGELALPRFLHLLLKIRTGARPDSATVRRRLPRPTP